MAAEKMSDQKVENKSKPAAPLPPPSSAVAAADKFRYQQIQLRTTEIFYLNTKLADVHFVFGSDGSDPIVTRVPAHKHLLAVVSDVFEKMFYGQLKETGDVTIMDTSADVFKEFLQFFYLTDVQLTIEYIIDILYLGHKYNVNECVIACVGFLKDNVNDENVCTVFTPAIFFEHQQLVKICDAHIKSNTDAVIKSHAFLECHREVLARILMMNLLSCTEVEVFEACMAWAKAKSGCDVLSKETVDTYLGDLFNKIPYGSMTIHQFCTLAAKYNMVFRRDFHSISNMFANPEFIQSENFNKSQCQFKWDGAKMFVRVPKWGNSVAKLILLSCLIFLVCNLLCNTFY